MSLFVTMLSKQQQLTFFLKEPNNRRSLYGDTSNNLGPNNNGGTSASSATTTASTGGVKSTRSFRDLGASMDDRNSLRLPNSYGRRKSFIHQAAVRVFKFK